MAILLVGNVQRKIELLEFLPIFDLRLFTSLALGENRRSLSVELLALADDVRKVVLAVWLMD